MASPGGIYELSHRFCSLILIQLDGAGACAAEDGRDALADLPPEDEGEDGDADDEEEADAIFCQKEGKTVRQVDLCQVHVDRVGGNEDDGEPEDDGPVRVGTGTLTRWWLTAVTRAANEEAKDSEETLKERTKKAFNVMNIIVIYTFAALGCFSRRLLPCL